MSFDDGFMLGLSLGGGGGGTGGGDDWTFPEHWLDIPDPEPNQVIMYVEANAGDVAPIICLNEGNGSITYGDDGYTYEWPEGYWYAAYHVYQTAGQYIITITANNLIVNPNSSYSNTAFMVGHIIEGYQGVYNGNSEQCCCIRAIKVGSSIICGTTAGDKTPIYGIHYGDNLVYLKFCGALSNDNPSFHNLYAMRKIDFTIPPSSFNDIAFQNCYALERADFTTNVTTFGDGMFSNCYCLKSVDLSNAEVIGTGTFGSCYTLSRIIAPNLTTMGGNNFNVCYNLEEFYAPKLTEIAEKDFSYCYSLQKLTLADGCNVNGNTFSRCPQLYPKPQ